MYNVSTAFLVALILIELCTLLHVSTAFKENKSEGCIEIRHNGFCDSNILNISKITSSCVDNMVTLNTFATPTIKASDGTIYVKSVDSILNYVVFAHNYPLCSYFSCPLMPNVSTSSSVTAFDFTFGATGGIDSKIKITDSNGRELACINAHFA